MTPPPASRAARGDGYAGVVPEPLDVATLRALSRMSPLTSAAHIAWEWALVLLAAWAGWRFWNPWLYPPLVAFIGARQHALIILMHEGAHYRLFRNRAANDWAAELLTAWPFALFTMRAYRRKHWPHHRHTNADGDPDWARKRTPDWEFPKGRWGLLRLLALDLVGVGFVKFLATARRLPGEGPAAPDGRRFKVARLAYLGAAAGCLTAFGLWGPFALFWLVPFVTWTQFAFHVRSIAEHFALPRRGGAFGQTRTTIPTALDRLFLVPKNVGYHLEHHLYPSVPFFNLPKLHAVLMGRPAYRAGAHVTRGYWRVLSECLTR